MTTSAHELPPADHAARRARLQANVDAATLGAFIVTAPANVRYLTGFTGSNGQLLMLPDEHVLITDGRYEERAATEAPGIAVALERNWIGLTVERAVEAGLRRITFEGQHVTFADGTDLQGTAGERGIEVTSAHGMVENLRMVKDAHEVAALEVACAITDAAFDRLIAHVRPGQTEREVARWLERTMEDLGADGRAFSSIVASGPNSAIPHHEPGERPLEVGDLLKVDFGARFSGYHADMTRTVSLGDPADDELVAVHALVAEAQAAGVQVAVADGHGTTVDQACREVIAAAGFADRFVHGTGHGVGLDIHEAPMVGGDRSGSLPAGTTITVEPGVYLPGRGGVRIEDTVLVTSDGPRCLTTSPRDLLRL